MLLDTEGVVWIADFGLAKGDDEGLTQSGDILGTLRYMAPERSRGEGDARADVYALGLTLYELLTLRPGFESSDRLKLIEQIKTEEPPRPRSIRAGGRRGAGRPRAEELGRAGRWSEAAGLLARCGRTGPLSRELAQAWVIASLKAGDRAGYREACAAFLAGQGPDPTVVSNALAGAGFFTLGAGGLDDYRVPMGWCEKRLSAVPAPPPLYRHIFSNALGGLLLRAGRVDEAIVRLKEGITAAVVEIPTDWAYLAMAHAKKGDLAEARRTLERLRAAGPDSSSSFWDLQELALLRGEAESLLFDIGFPSDPFLSPGPR